MLASKFDKLLWRISRKASLHRQSRFIETSDCSFRIRDTGGDDTALVFLCDPPVTVEAYDKLIACFQPDHRVIVIELPSFGFTRISNASALTFEGAVRETEAAIKSLNLERCIVFGPCVCGFVAAELVARQQLPIKGLVLMQTPDRAGMLAWVERMDPKGLLRIPFIGQLIVRFTARRISKFWLKYATAKHYDSSNLVQTCDLALAQGGGYPLASMLQLWSKGTKDSNLNVPALSVWGKQDRSHKKTSTASTCKHVPNAEILEFSDCGHFTELEAPVEFSNAVQPFINRYITTSD